MWLADTSVKRPVFATMVIMALVVLGAVSYPEIGVDLFPKVDFPIVTISTHLNGASPEVIDVDVTDKIEGSVNTINGVKTITSSSTEGDSRVTVEFVLERDIDLAVQDVREKVALIRNKLPEDIDEPRIAKVDPDATAVMWLNLSGQKTVRELSTYVDEVLKEQLQRINGVGDIQLFGLQLRQVRVWLDSGKLQAYGLSASDVMGALQRQNVELPGGRIESLSKEYTVKVKGEFLTVPEFNDLVIAYDKGAPVRLRDIGKAEDGMEERRSIARFNGIPAVTMGVQKQSGTNTVEVVDRVKAEIVKINKTLPPGMTLNIAIDQSVFIRRSIEEVQKHLILGSLFAVLAVFIFLGNVRTTLISAVALPISIIATFALIRAFGFTFNNMTMLALTLSVGLLIDDAIIVIENIYRHVEEGMAPREAATFATTEIGLAVMATTFAIVAIFLPVAFMKGMIGRFFLQFALTVVFSILVSLLVSFTLTPMLASIFLKPAVVKREGSAGAPAAIKPHRRLADWFDRGYKKLEAGYRRRPGLFPEPPGDHAGRRPGPVCRQPLYDEVPGEGVHPAGGPGAVHRPSGGAHRLFGGKGRRALPAGGGDREKDAGGPGGFVPAGDRRLDQPGDPDDQPHPEERTEEVPDGSEEGDPHEAAAVSRPQGVGGGLLHDRRRAAAGADPVQRPGARSRRRYRTTRSRSPASFQKCRGLWTSTPPSRWANPNSRSISTGTRPPTSGWTCRPSPWRSTSSSAGRPR